MSELKKCPFCGGEAKLMTSSFFAHDAVVICKRCGGRTLTHTSSSHEDAKMNAVKAWNTRKPVDDVVEALEELEEKFFHSDFEADRFDLGAFVAYRNAVDIVKEILNE